MNNIGFFQEKTGVNSMQRVISFLLVCVGCFIALLATFAIIFKTSFGIEAGIQLYSFSFSLIISGITSKAIAKGQEAKVLKL